MAMAFIETEKEQKQEQLRICSANGEIGESSEQNGDVGSMNEEVNTVPGVFQCSLCKKLCKDYRGMRIHQALAHKVRKQKYSK